MNSRKREKPYFSPQGYCSSPKRRRSLPLDGSPASDAAGAGKSPATVVVSGVPAEFSLLDLKSRLEVYGPISRTRMETNGVAYVTFRSEDAAQSAVDASRDSIFPLTLLSVPVQVMWASDPIPRWKAGVGRKHGMLSKLVRAELPLSRLGRGNKLGSSPVVNPKDMNKSKVSANDDVIHDYKPKGFGGIGNAGLGGRPLRVREIVVYDDIL